MPSKTKKQQIIDLARRIAISNPNDRICVRRVADRVNCGYSYTRSVFDQLKKAGVMTHDRRWQQKSLMVAHQADRL